MRIDPHHSWDVTPSQARAIQTELRDRVDRTARVELGSMELVAGVDASYAQIGDDTICIAAIIVFSFPDLVPVEEVVARLFVTFPYVPGLLTFREGPAILEAAGQIKTEPDIMLFDGQGIAHPRRIGVASHMGVILNRPTIGCAKSKLTGSIGDRVQNDLAPLVDRGETIGMALHTRPRALPLIVSTGNLICLEDAVAVTRACCRDGRRLPVPTRMAHELVSHERLRVFAN